MKSLGRYLPAEQRVGARGRLSIARSNSREAARGRVLVVDQHELFATALGLALATRRWTVATSCGPTPDAVLADAARLHADCVLLDVRLGDGLGSGVELIAPLTRRGARVVMLTAERRRPILGECLEAGAEGWINKGTTLDELDAALVRVMEGGSVIGRTQRADALAALRRERDHEAAVCATFERLSGREALVLAALSDGLSAEKIARDHYVALTTIRSQIRAVLQKLGVQSQLEAVAIAGAHRELLPDSGHSKRDRRRMAVRRDTVAVQDTANTA